VESLLRPWSEDDLASLVRHANNRRVARNLRDGFPHPYTPVDGSAFLAAVAGDRPALHLAIQVHGKAVGGIGVRPGVDVERVSGEIGFWLGETFWGQGLCTAAVRTFVDYVFDGFALHRLFAMPFLRNLRSQRVLEKAGFRREGILSESAIKEGQLESQALYALTRPEWTERATGVEANAEDRSTTPP